MYKRSSWIWLILTVGLLTVLAACGQSQEHAGVVDATAAAPVQATEQGLAPQVVRESAPEAASPVEPQTAAATVEAFYDWYLAYIGEPGSNTFRNPLVNRAYRDAPYLSRDFVEHVDDMLAQFESELGGIGYDPILCAQDIPAFVTPEATFERSGMAGVVMQSSFPNQRITAVLRPEGAGWLIRDIRCAMDAPGVAEAFYTWYLGSMGDRSSDAFRNLLVEGAYRDHPLLTEALVQEVDEVLAASEQGGFDPFLLAQDIPRDFSVDPGRNENTAVVHLQFGPDAVRHLLVTMDETGRRITAIGEDGGARPAEAATGGSAALGVLFNHPADWVVQEMALDGPGMPDDWPVVAGWMLMPADVAAALPAAGPPDPDTPVIVAPFHIELLQGDEAALERVYGSLDGGTIQFDTHEATVLRRDPGYRHAVFAHPLRPQTWVVVTDWVSEFPGRQAQAVTAAPLWEPLLAGLQFVE